MRWLGYLVARQIFRIFFRVGFGLEAVGREHVPKRGAFILASNHVSFLDPPVVGAASPRRMRFMARADLFQRPFIGAFLRLTHVIPIRRGEGDVFAIRQALAALRRGEPVAMFPEGTRQLSGRLGAARRGVGLLALKARVPIVPVVVSGTFEALPPDAAGLSRSKIRVAFGESIPYTTTSLTRRHEQTLADAVTAQWRRLAAQQKT